MAATKRRVDFTEADDEGFVRLSTVAPKAVKWLWRGKIPSGKITILDGDPDNGKSAVTLDWAARVTTGRPFPGEVGHRPARSVVLVCAEDDVDDTIVPRLLAAGANLKKVVTIPLPRDENGMVEPLTLPDDLNRIERVVRRTNAALVIIDPITAYLGERIDSHKDASVRRATTPLAFLMAELECAAVLVRHLNKDSKESNPLYRGGGSIGLSGAARSTLVVAPHPSGDPNEKVLARVKGNLTTNRDAIGYRLEASDDYDVPVVEWLGVVDVDMSTLLAKKDARLAAPIRDECVKALMEILSDGPVPQVDAERVLKKNGFSDKTIRNAREHLHVETKAERDKGRFVGWMWSLPQLEEI